MITSAALASSRVDCFPILTEMSTRYPSVAITSMAGNTQRILLTCVILMSTL